MALGAYMHPYSYMYYAPYRDGVLHKRSPRVDFTVRGPPREVFIAGGGGDLEGGEQEGVTPEELGMSDLIRLEFAPMTTSAQLPLYFTVFGSKVKMDT